MNSDFDALLSRLAKHRVKYLVVGGYAVIHYCEPRYTKDIDIFVEASADAHRHSQVDRWRAVRDGLEESSTGEDWGADGQFDLQG